jgi:hypothetical protein
MKQYVVIRLLPCINSTSIEEFFDNINDAQTYAEILNRQRKDDGYEYRVFVAVQA